MALEPDKFEFQSGLLSLQYVTLHKSLIFFLGRDFLSWRKGHSWGPQTKLLDQRENFLSTTIIAVISIITIIITIIKVWY